MPPAFRVDARGLDTALAGLRATPAQAAKARARALSKLLTWVRREVARVVSAAVGMPQKNFIALARLNNRRRTDGAIEVWIGTNPVAAEYLGRVRWRRQWEGAKAGGRTYPGAFSWAGKTGAKTGAAVLRRAGADRLPLTTVSEPIHDLVRAALPDLEARILARFETLLRQELNYATRVETRAA